MKINSIWYVCILPLNLIWNSEHKGKIILLLHTTYSRKNMHQKRGGDCGLWVLNVIIKKIYPENMKKIVGFTCYLNSTANPPIKLKLGWTGCAI